MGEEEGEEEEKEEEEGQVEEGEDGPLRTTTRPAFVEARGAQLREVAAEGGPAVRRPRLDGREPRQARPSLSSWSSLSPSPTLPLSPLPPPPPGPPPSSSASVLLVFAVFVVAAGRGSSYWPTRAFGGPRMRRRRSWTSRGRRRWRAAVVGIPGPQDD